MVPGSAAEEDKACDGQIKELPVPITATLSPPGGGLDGEVATGAAVETAIATLAEGSYEKNLVCAGLPETFGPLGRERIVTGGKQTKF